MHSNVVWADQRWNVWISEALAPGDFENHQEFSRDMHRDDDDTFREFDARNESAIQPVNYVDDRFYFDWLSAEQVRVIDSFSRRINTCLY